MGNGMMENDRPTYGAATLALHADDTLNTVSDVTTPMHITTNFRLGKQSVTSATTKVFKSALTHSQTRSLILFALF